MLTDLGLYNDCTNLGSLRLIEYAPIAWVDQASYEKLINTQYRWVEDITFTTGDWMQAWVLPRKRIFSEAQKENGQQGAIYEKRVEGILPRHSPAIASLLDEMQRHRFILRLTDRNGQRYIVGEAAYPFTFSSQLTTGEDATELNHNRITWESVSPHRSYGASL